MIISVNELLQDLHTEQVYRVLWVDSEHEYCFVINIEDEKDVPTERKVQYLIDEIVTGGMAKSKDDPYLAISIREIPDSHKERRDSAWRIIGPLVEQEPDIYGKDKRGPLVQKAMELHKVTHRTIYKYLKSIGKGEKNPMLYCPIIISLVARGREKVLVLQNVAAPRSMGRKELISMKPQKNSSVPPSKSISLPRRKTISEKPTR
ncbi:hypothetical protein [Paenibacillus maysiensis]|uniref:hypothetical protein n=1 Tax=Paenibacillus maysiensis TaxID=1155954 RepID=UPI0004B58FBD|nr:hypothetical protein [Paenibacillus maysiensis]